MDKWIGASVVYTGQGSYFLKEWVFRPNRSVVVDDRSIVDQIRGVPFFKIQDLYQRVMEEPEVEPVLPVPTPQPKPKPIREKKRAPVKKTKKVKKKTGVSR